MATKKTTTSQEDAVFESGLDEVMAEMQLSQADDETDQEDALSAAQDTLESSLIPQTDSEPLNEDRIPAEDAARNALPDIIPQTDIENENPGEVCSGSMHSNTPDQQIPQTDSDAAETPPEGSSPTRGIRKSRAKKSESGTETEKQPEEVPDGVVEPVKPSRRTTSARPASVVSIDARPTVETEEDKARNDLLDLMESLKSKRILTDTIQGIELLQSYIMAISRLLFRQRKPWNLRKIFVAGFRRMCCTICSPSVWGQKWTISSWVSTQLPALLSAAGWRR